MQSDCHVDYSVSIHTFILSMISHGSHAVDYTINILDEIGEGFVLEAVTFNVFDLWELALEFRTSYISRSAHANNCRLWIQLSHSVHYVVSNETTGAGNKNLFIHLLLLCY